MSSLQRLLGDGKDTSSEDTSASSSEVYSYTAPWPVFSFNFASNPQYPFQLVLGSFIEDISNQIQVVQLMPDQNRFEVRTTVPHTYAPTKLM